MSESILVVEYEPRYTERVQKALAGGPFTPWFAKDGEEAMQAISARPLKLIVLSSVIPKVSTADLIRAIRGRDQSIPILLTVSGYSGKTPRQDAVRLGASDILAKPYTESEFLGKIQHMLGVVTPGTLTSSEIFGDILDDEAVPPAGARKPMSQKDDIDKLLADTLGGVLPKKKEHTSPGTTPKPVTAPGTTPAPKPKSDFDKAVEDTLSGLEKKKTATNVPLPKATEPAAKPIPPRMPTPLPDRIPVSYPVLVATPPAPVVKEEEEPKDGIRFGQYVLLEKIATGGMAEVWKARKRGEEGFQKIVAIKKILPHLSDNQEFIEMFIDEAKLAAQLNHNNIIHIYDLGKTDSSYFIAMEYIDGFDLKTILRQAVERDQPLSVELALFIASKIAAALDYAHRKRDFDQKEMGLVHRDVSPQNVLISQEGDIKLCDFGIAKAASKASHTQSGALKGKLQYMAPEQAWGRNIDRRSDIFALGTVLFELLTNRKLFQGDNEMSILEQVREARVDTPPSNFNEEVTPEIDRIVLKALAKDPEARYQTAAEMARELDSVLYNFKPTPTSADLAIFMHRLWSEAPPAPAVVEKPLIIDEPRQYTPPSMPAPLPAPIPQPIPPPVAPPPPPPVAAAPVVEAVPVMPAWDAPPAAHVAEKKRSAAVPLGVAAVLIAGIIGGFLYVRSRGAAPAVTASNAATPAVTTQAPVVDTAATGTVVPLTATTATTSTVATGTALDPNLVAQEVEKRLAAERTRLEGQARAQQAAAAAAQRPVPTAAAAPPPVTQTTAPAPAPAPVQTATVAPPPVETVAQPTPQPVQETPAPARVKEGDLVPPGTDGLIPGKVLRRGVVGYPPLARQNRVEGTVLLNVLVSESGKVLEVRILRGVNRAVGLNEAAIESARRSTFSAPTKDGVRVKAWTTLPVDFKL